MYIYILLCIHYQIVFVSTARTYDYRQTMFIIQLCLTVMPLLYITTANTNIFSGHAVKDFSVDSNATIMAFGDPKGACKFMFLDPESNTTCCYSNNAQELCKAAFTLSGKSERYRTASNIFDAGLWR